MSDDPYLYNDQLQNSTDPLVGWNNVPWMVQKETFEHSGCIRKLSLQRVCQRWKSLLDPERWHATLLMNEFLQVEPPYFCSKSSGIRTFDDSRYKYHLGSLERYGEIMRGVLKKTRVMIIDFTEADSESEDFQRRLHWLNSFIGILAGSGLENIVVVSGRMPPCSYFDLFHELRLGELSKRPLKFSFVGCSLLRDHTRDTTSKLAHSVELDGGNIIGSPEFIRNELERKRFGEPAMVMPTLSFRCPTTEEDLCRQLLLMFKKLIFPYTVTQIQWLENCLKMVHNQDDPLIGRQFSAYLFDYCYMYRPMAGDHDWCTLVKKYCRDIIEADLPSEIKYATASLFLKRVDILAASVPFFAGKISARKLNFPVPPEPVSLSVQFTQ